MILYSIVNRTEASQKMILQSRQSSLATARHSTDGHVLLSFNDTDGIPSEFVGRDHYTTDEIIVETEGERWHGI